MQVTQTSCEPTESMMREGYFRLAAHNIVNALPDEALREAVEKMTRIAEFWNGQVYGEAVCK